MANNIQTFKKYIPYLDLVYKKESLTSLLDVDDTLVKQGANASEIVIPMMKMDGLGSYSRNGGYKAGNVTLTHETVPFTYDRGRKFSVDAMDNEETAGVAFGRLGAEFVRTMAVPEQDAYRFSTYASKTGISKATPVALTSANNALTALIAAQNKMDEDEVATQERYLFITPTILNMILNVDTTKSKAVLDSFAGIIKVPQSRFYTSVDLFDGESDGEETGGYKKATAGKDINFMVVHKPCILQYNKHVVNKVISPELNQESDGYLFFYRSYGLANVYENKLAGVYLHANIT